MPPARASVENSVEKRRGATKASAEAREVRIGRAWGPIGTREATVCMRSPSRTGSRDRASKGEGARIPLAHVDREGRRLPRAVDLHHEVARLPQARVRLERDLGLRHVVAVDHLEAVAVLQVEHAEDALGSDAEEAHAEHLAVLLIEGDADRLLQ